MCFIYILLIFTDAIEILLESLKSNFACDVMGLVVVLVSFQSNDNNCMTAKNRQIKF